jgi:translation initiation factor 3 subunit L
MNERKEEEEEELVNVSAVIDDQKKPTVTHNNNNTATATATTNQTMNETTKEFIIYLRELIKSSCSSGNTRDARQIDFSNRHQKNALVQEIGNAYEKTFTQLSEQYYKNKNWPQRAIVEKFLKDYDDDDGDDDAMKKKDTFFLSLYEELWFRHAYARTAPPSLDERVESWFAYCKLFDLVLGSVKNDDDDDDKDSNNDGGDDASLLSSVVLPNVWLWDMVDEFIYQFQSFCQYRGKLHPKTEKEIVTLKQLKENDEVWQKDKVTEYLTALQKKSGLIVVGSDGNGQNNNGDDDEGGVEKKVAKNKSSVLQDTLGYFAVVGLARVQCLSGEYELSLRTFDALPDLMVRASLNSKIPGCHVSVNYHVGFAYFMLNRYKDASIYFTRGISYVERLHSNLRRRENGENKSSTGSHSPGGRIELLRKKSEQMLSLLSIAITMSCGSGSTSSRGVMNSLDDHTRTLLREKYGDKMSKMNNGEVDAFADLFAYSCPKFIATNEIIQSIGSGSYAADLSLSYNQEAYKKQLAVFMEEVHQRAPLPLLRSYLKLYASISVQKLAQLMEITEEELKKNLEVLQEKSKNVVEFQKEYCKSLLDGVEVSKLNAQSGSSHWNNNFDAMEIVLEEDGKTVRVLDHFNQDSTTIAAASIKDAEIFSRHIRRLAKTLKDLEICAAFK